MNHINTLSIAIDPKDPPRELRLFRVGVNQSLKGPFVFDAAAAREVMATYQAMGHPLAIDYDHGSIQKDAIDPSQSGKSAGRFDLELRGGELWAVNIRWSPAADAAIRREEWPFISPAFQSDEEGRVFLVLNFALTSNPALFEPARLIAASATHNPQRRSGDPMTLEDLLAENDRNCAGTAAASNALLGLQPNGAPAVRYETLSVQDKHRLGNDDPDRFQELLADWRRRGSPESTPTVQRTSLVTLAATGARHVRYENLTMMDKDALARQSSERFNALRADWQRRGEPEYQALAVDGAPVAPAAKVPEIPTFGGKKLEELTFAEREILAKKNPPLLEAMLADWEKRGRPKPGDLALNKPEIAADAQRRGEGNVYFNDQDAAPVALSYNQHESPSLQRERYLATLPKNPSTVAGLR